MPNLTRFFATLLVSLPAAATAPVASAQQFPTKPIRLIIPNAPGGTPDAVGRLLASEMGKVLDRQIIVENRPGANGIIGYSYVAKQPADGYTLGLVQVNELANLPWVAKGLTFDPIKDLTPIIGIVEGRLVLETSPAASWKSFGELVAYAKGHPGKLNYGFTSTSTLFPTLALIQDTGIEVAQIPFNGASTQFMIALATGEVHMGMSGVTAALSAGSKLRIIAVTGAQRSRDFKDVPTFIELGYPNIEGNSFSLNVPQGTPKATADILHAAALKALQQPEVISRYGKMGQDVSTLSSDEVGKKLAELTRQSGALAKRIGLKPE
jgi:tripartite-type tricarboxylate transporter receptor subunit TctC